MKKLRFNYRVEKSGTEVFMYFQVGAFGGAVCGNDRSTAKTALVELAEDYIQHEGRTDAVWRDVRSVNDIVFVEF
jgi:hypothetical protein